MSAPVQHGICTGGYLPLLKRIVDLKDTYITFQDNFPTIYKRFGIKRDEMMIVMPQVMRADVLCGTEQCTYIDE